MQGQVTEGMSINPDKIRRSATYINQWNKWKTYVVILVGLGITAS